MPEPVLSNTLPLYYLNRLGLLELLRTLYGEILVPLGVQNELEAGAALGLDVPDLPNLEWVDLRQVDVPDALRLVTDLGRGEAEVLALALAHPGCLVILDERLARQIAELNGIRVTGTAGVLLRAKAEGHLDAAPLVDQLDALGFRLTAAVRERILRLAGEVS